MMTPKEREAICASGWFSSLGPLLRHDLLRAMTVRRYRSGQPIYERGSGVDAWLACACGSVRLTQDAASGRTCTLAFVSAGRWFGEIPLSRPARRSQDAYAHGETSVVSISAQQLQRILSEHPAFYGNLLELQAARMRQLSTVVAELSCLSLRERLVSQLVLFMQRFGIAGSQGPEVRLSIRLRQDQWADLLGCSRQRLNEHLGTIAKQNVIRREAGCLIVTDPSRLLQLAGRSGEV